ncbi:hypothetical protein FACS1894171_0820 [Clostridia bacterium]|nr:hypothetical protein FACS1894171_0820 [Clostridia bacterium]
MARYTIDEVKIEGAYPVGEILELSMDIGVNAHGTLTYGGLVSEDAAIKYIQQSADGQFVKVFLRGNLEFCGYLQNITVDSQNKYHYLRVVLVSGSQLIDITPCDRFFQDTSRAFADIITEAYDDSGIGTLVAIRGMDAIKKPILQYRETDWQFTLRMAGRLGTVVVPDVTAEKPYAALGIPERPIQHETSAAAYSVGRDDSAYRRVFQTDVSVGYSDFLCRKMDCANRYKLGDSVKMDGDIFVVVRKSFCYQNGEIVEHYILGHEREFAVPYHDGIHITGLELEGKVLDRLGQEMRVLLDIDSARESDGKIWFSYAPCTNNGMYSMPLKDEKVMLQWQSAADEDILIVRPNRKNGFALPRPGDRHFLTEHKAHLKMIPGEIEFTNPVGNIAWRAAEGFNISTGGNLSISAQRDINITSERQVRVYSPERISVCKTGAESSIDMISDELHIKAVTNVKSTSKTNKYKKTTLPERRPKTEIDALTASKLAAAIPRTSNIGK